MHCLQNMNEPQNQYVFLLLFYSHKMHLLALLGLIFTDKWTYAKHGPPLWT